MNYTTNCLTGDICNAILSHDIQANCNNPQYSGIEVTGIIINYDDIDTITRDSENQSTIIDIQLKTGKYGYKFVQDSKSPFTGTNTTMNVNDIRNDFTLTVAGYIPTDGATASKEILTPLANGRYVVILQNQWANDSNDNHLQVFGADRGLVTSSLQQTRYENSDAWQIELTEENVPRASTFYIPTSGDECTALNALLYEA